MKKIKLEIKWAIIFVAMMLLWMFLERLLGFHDERIALHPIVTNLVIIPAIFVYYLAMSDKRKSAYDGVMSYKQGFLCGITITVIITFVSPLTQYITSTVISPDYFQKMIAFTSSEGVMTEADAKAYFTLKNYLVQTVMLTPILGLIITSIAALFAKRKAHRA